MANPEQLVRRLNRAIVALALLLVLVVVNSFLHEDENPFNPIARAAERTEQMPGGRYDLAARYTSDVSPQGISATGEGAYNARTGLASATLTMPLPQVGRTLQIEVVGDDTTQYMRGNPISEELPPGKEWVAIQPFGGASQNEAMVAGGTADSLKLLRAVGDDVTRIGSEPVRGVSTTRYRATIDLGRYADLLRAEGKNDFADYYESATEDIEGPIVTEVWIDRGDLVRAQRIEMTMSTGEDGPSITMDMKMELHDIGAAPDISLPDPARVVAAENLAG